MGESAGSVRVLQSHEYPKLPRQVITGNINSAALTGAAENLR